MHEPHPEIDRYKWRKNSSGYIVRDINLVGQKRQRIYQHRAIYELHYGPIPDGYELHHKNEVKDDNRLENIMCVTREQHKWLHAGAYVEDGAWFLQCKECRLHLKINDGNFWRSSQRRDGTPGWYCLDVCITCYPQYRAAIDHATYLRNREKVIARSNARRARLRAETPTFRLPSDAHNAIR